MGADETAKRQNAMRGSMVNESEDSRLATGIVRKGERYVVYGNSTPKACPCDRRGRPYIFEVSRILEVREGQCDVAVTPSQAKVILQYVPALGPLSRHAKTRAGRIVIRGEDFDWVDGWAFEIGEGPEAELVVAKRKKPRAQSGSSQKNAAR